MFFYFLPGRKDLHLIILLHKGKIIWIRHTSGENKWGSPPELRGVIAMRMIWLGFTTRAVKYTLIHFDSRSHWHEPKHLRCAVWITWSDIQIQCGHLLRPVPARYVCSICLQHRLLIAFRILTFLYIDELWVLKSWISLRVLPSL